jgi:chromosomal replication initiation ATPase DnaA
VTDPALIPIKGRAMPFDHYYAEKLIEQAEKESDFSEEEIRGHSRKADLVWVRWLTMTAIWRATRLSMVTIGKLFDNRDHTSVMYAIRKVEKQAKERPEVEVLLARWAGKVPELPRRPKQRRLERSPK